jgi:hypothetical protein
MKNIYTVNNIYPEMTDEEREQAEHDAIVYIMRTMEKLNKEQNQKKD